MSYTGYEIRFPVIRVKDKAGDSSHIVGTNSHDVLHIVASGRGIGYYNLQNGCDTTKNKNEYEFVSGAEQNELSPYPEIEFVTLEELIDIAKKESDMSAERERKLRESAKKGI